MIKKTFILFFITVNLITLRIVYASNDIVLWMELKSNKIIYKFDSKTIPAQKLLDFFGDIYSTRKTEPTIIVLFQEKINFSALLNIKMIIKKVANYKIRIYYYNKETQQSQEIFFADHLTPLSDFKE